MDKIVVFVLVGAFAALFAAILYINVIIAYQMGILVFELAAVLMFGLFVWAWSQKDE